MTAIDLLVASSPIIVLMVSLAWRGIPTLIEWRRERRYQAEWHRTFVLRAADRAEGARGRRRASAASRDARRQPRQRGIAPHLGAYTGFRARRGGRDTTGAN